MNTETKRPAFEAWCETQSLETGRDNEGDYISLETALSWKAWQAALASPEVQALRDALWTCAEHNTLHFGKSHNTVIKARAALAAMEKQK